MADLKHSNGSPWRLALTSGRSLAALGAAALFIVGGWAAISGLAS